MRSLFCTLPVNFTPTAAGNFLASAIISSNATVPVYNVSVSGHATAPALLAEPTSGLAEAGAHGVVAAS